MNYDNKIILNFVKKNGLPRILQLYTHFLSSYLTVIIKTLKISKNKPCEQQALPKNEFEYKNWSIFEDVIVISLEEKTQYYKINIFFATLRI